MTNNRKDKKRENISSICQSNLPRIFSVLFMVLIPTTVKETGNVPDFLMFRGATVNKYPNRHVQFSDGRYGEKKSKGCVGSCHFR